MTRSNRLPIAKLNRRSTLRTREQFDAFLNGADAPKTPDKSEVSELKEREE